jgi:hypothetical protein
MSDKSNELRDQLLNVQEMNPALREAYRKELDSMLHPPMTVRSGLLGVILLAVLLPIPFLLGRTALLHPVGPLTLTAYAAFGAACLWGSLVILRDIRRKRHSRNSTISIANALTSAAGIMTVAVLLIGLKNPGNPKSLFDLFYLFVFYFACSMWNLDSRIQATELSAREQSLRLECRLADLADRLSDK